MEQLTMKIAGTAVEVHFGFGSTREYFRAYLTDDPPEYTVEITEALRTEEQKRLDEEADREGLKRRIFSQPFLERAAIQRRIASILLQQDVLLLHGSTVAVDGRAWLFTASCGVGKSTHTRLWRELLGERAVMVNDDRAFLRRSPERYLAFGSPWSGKHGLDTNISANLAGICILSRGKENAIRPASPEEALAFLLGQMYLPEEASAGKIRELTRQLVRNVPVWQMNCNKEIEAAAMAYTVMSGTENKEGDCHAANQ